MRLIKQHGRTYGDKDYYKFIVVIPNKDIEKLGWKGGEELETEIKGNKLVIEKD
jgi:bifunctional DNA-binding transcriptional regulator/antitoxin component of YhaV-PrlF toxin-antitoxin module